MKEPRIVSQAWRPPSGYSDSGGCSGGGLDSRVRGSMVVAGGGVWELGLESGWGSVGLGRFVIESGVGVWVIMISNLETSY